MFQFPLFLYSNTKFFSSCLRRVAFLFSLSLSFCAFICARLSRQGCRRCRTERKKKWEKLVIFVYVRVFPTFFSSSCEMCVFSLDISQKKEKRERKQKKSFGNERTIWWGWKLMWYSIFLLYAFFFISYENFRVESRERLLRREHLLS